jgi:hypothetical protein
MCLSRWLKTLARVQQKWAWRQAHGSIGGAPVCWPPPDILNCRAGGGQAHREVQLGHDNLIVIRDDIDLKGANKNPHGRAIGGTSCIDSIIGEMDSEDFIRVRWE